jgi:hypothetical protein
MKGFTDDMKRKKRGRRGRWEARGWDQVHRFLQRQFGVNIFGTTSGWFREQDDQSPH